MTDPIADMLTKIRNAVMIRKSTVKIPFSKIKFEIAKILEREGFVKSITKEAGEDNKSPWIVIGLKYRGLEATVRGIKRVSRPSLRIYKGYKEMPRVLPSLGLWIVSTSRGMMTNAESKKQKIGGEIICEIY